jgi:hypothetical protein
MKIAVRRTFHGDRPCLPGIVPDALVDLRAACARMLVVRDAVGREDAVYGATAAGARAAHGLLPVVTALGVIVSSHHLTIRQIARAVRPGETYTPDERAGQAAGSLLDDLNRLTSLLHPVRA